jgi:hypothetical protein
MKLMFNGIKSQSPLRDINIDTFEKYCKDVNLLEERFVSCCAGPYEAAKARQQSMQSSKTVNGGGTMHSYFKNFSKLRIRSHSRSRSKKSPERKAPSRSGSTAQTPFADDHVFAFKYGTLDKGFHNESIDSSVLLMKRRRDNAVFAVKESRLRHSYETQNEYVKKITTSYDVCSALHHNNIIETFDLVQEKGKLYLVMEYAPFNLFDIAISNRMSREEIKCCFAQILSGVTHLHNTGLARLDLKLENILVSHRGIMKIVGFKSSYVFNSPSGDDFQMALGKRGRI